jgi:hypothetical protein
MFLEVEPFDVNEFTTLKADATTLSGMKMGLFTNALVPSKKLVLANVTEPTYAGYARQAVVFGAVERDVQGNIACEAALLTFQMTNALTPTLVYGYFLTCQVAAILAGVELFPAPKNLNDSLDYIGIVLKWIFSNPTQGLAILTP